MSAFQIYQAVKVKDSHPEFPGAAGNIRSAEFPGEEGAPEGEQGPFVMVHMDGINTEVPMAVADLVLI